MNNANYFLGETFLIFQLGTYFCMPYPLNRPAQSSAVVQPMPITNPFGTLPAMPQMSIGRGGTAPSVQYGISSMPVNMHPLWTLFTLEIVVLVCV